MLLLELDGGLRRVLSHVWHRMHVLDYHLGVAMRVIDVAVEHSWDAVIFMILLCSIAFYF